MERLRIHPNPKLRQTMLFKRNVTQTSARRRALGVPRARPGRRGRSGSTSSQEGHSRGYAGQRGVGQGGVRETGEEESNLERATVITTCAHVWQKWSTRA